MGKLNKKLELFKTQIHKNTDLEIESMMINSNKRLGYTNSGSTIINMLIGGSMLPDRSFLCPGYPKGRIIEIYGPESSGKTTFALAGMAAAIKSGGAGLYVDNECAVVDNYALKLGVDFRPEGDGNAIRVSPFTAEETESLVNTAAVSGVDFIVVDSVAGLVPGKEAKRDVSDEKDKKGIAEIPRIMSAWMPKLQTIIARTGTTVIFLNQTRDKIGAFGFSEEAKKSTTGGNALRFWSSVRLSLKPKTKTTAKIFNPITNSNEDIPISTDVLVKVIKNKIDAKQGQSGLVTIRYGTGLDEMRTMMNVADAYGIMKIQKVKGSGEKVSFTDPKSGEIIEAVGVEKFRKKIQSNGEIFSSFLHACQERIVRGFESISDDLLAELAENAITKSNPDDDDYDMNDLEVVDKEEMESSENDNDPGNE